MVHLAESEGPFTEFMGIRLVESSDGRGKAVMPVRREFLQGAGVVQGGLIVTLADHAVYLAVRSLMQEDETSVTVELKVNFIAPASSGELTGEASVVSRGRRIVISDVEVRGESDALIARGLCTTLVRKRRQG